ncbi:hypothetical protein, partial [Parabacteroides sp. D25]|uniref:hypothetical protein n=1 Tax=Parabacteroides sp. D25 TaxID=658661 RepID=UPI001E3D5714
YSKLLSDGGRRSTLRLYNWEMIISHLLRYFPSSLIFQAMVIFRKAIFKNIKCCLSGVNRVLLVGL